MKLSYGLALNEVCMVMRCISHKTCINHCQVLGRDKVGIKAISLLMVHGVRVLWYIHIYSYVPRRTDNHGTIKGLVRCTHNHGTIGSMTYYYALI